MKTPHGKHTEENRYTPYRREHCPIARRVYRSCLFSYSQACLILKAIELNERKKLSKKCIAHLAVFVSHAWEEKPEQEKIHQVYYMINNLLDTTSMDINEPFDISIQKYCSNTVSTPTISPSVTLLFAISYIEKLNKRYRDLKGTNGCACRMIMIAYMMASKYIHDSLQLIIYTNSRSSINNNNNKLASQKLFISTNSQNIILQFDPTNNTAEGDTSSAEKDRNIRIVRMELEFLHFLNYDLSVPDPIMLVKWAQAYDTPVDHPEKSQDYTSADEGDDEQEDEDS